MHRLLRYVRHHHLGLAALFVALGGTSYAAITLPRNSVGANQIRTGAVASAEVRDGSLLAKDFRKGQLPKGAKGDAGTPGLPGAKGDKGDRGDAGPVDRIAARLTIGSSRVLSVPDAGSGPLTAMTPLTFADGSYAQYDENSVTAAKLFNPDLVVAPPGDGRSVLTVPKTGTYVLTAEVRWDANATGQRALAINAPQPTGVLVQNIVEASSAGRTVQNVATTTRLNAGDQVFASVGQNSGGALQIQGSQSQVHFAVTYVGP